MPGWRHCDFTKCMTCDKLQQCHVCNLEQTWAGLFTLIFQGPDKGSVAALGRTLSRAQGQVAMVGSWRHHFVGPWARDTLQSEPVTMTNNLRCSRWCDVLSVHNYDGCSRNLLPKLKCSLWRSTLYVIKWPLQLYCVCRSTVHLPHRTTQPIYCKL